MSDTADMSVDHAGGADDGASQVGASSAFTAFGDAAAGLCGDVCAIPSGSLSAGIA